MKTDYVVIGAGVMGSATAQWLAARGARVVLTEQFARGHTRGGSHGDSRIVRLAYPDDDYVALALESLRLWRDLEATCGHELLARTGGADHGPGVVESIGGALSRAGVTFQVLTAAEAMDRWPGMRFEGEVVYQPDAGRLHADDAVRALQDLAERNGADLRFDCAASLSRSDDDGVVVSTDRGDLEAEVAIVAAGPWTPRLVPPDVAIPPLRVTHEEPAYFPPRVPNRSPAPQSPPWPVFVHYDASPDKSFAAYGMGVPGRGAKVGLHASGAAIDPDAAERPRSADVRDRLAEYVCSWLPGLEPEPTEVVSCVYDSTPGEDFVIGRRGRVVVATGFSGHGFKFAPAVGRIVGRLARGETDTPTRFRLRSA